MTLRRAAWLCLGSGAGLLALAWLAWDGDYLLPLGAAGLLAVFSGSQLLTAAIQLPNGKPAEEDPA